MRTPHHLLGLDLGQANDYTAWVTVEQLDRVAEPAAYDVRDIERVRGEPYPEIVSHTRLLVDTLRAQQPRPEVTLVVDFTGVGRPVADLLVAARIDANLRLVTITGADQETIGERGERRVPKRNLASAVQVLLQSKRLRIGWDLSLAGVLTAELVNFRVKINLAGHDSYGAGAEWREGNHDDLVLALALACWQGERFPHPVVAAPVTVPGRGFFSLRASDTFTLDDPWDVDPWE